MYIWWIFLFFTCQTIVAEQLESKLPNNSGIFPMKINIKNIGRVKYRDGEIIIAQNQEKHAEFFFTPFPYLQPEETQCHENVFNDRIELGFQAELYTPQLIQTVNDYLFKYQSSLCGNTTSLFVCDVSLLPINSIQLVQRGSHSNSIHHKYTLDESWQPATLHLQEIEFVIYVSNMAVCEQLRKALTEKCRLPNFEVHYSLYAQQIVKQELEVNTKHIARTNIYNQICIQFPSAETVILTENDFKKLLSESTDYIIMPLRMQEGFAGLQNPMVFDEHLERQLSTQRVRNT
ncbi:unnamed protein product [Adineta steineri]|uniref:Uncharacterized protein n=1 Tax=Adineta steineri TaxID=433720 RepID=A0A819EU94_9BILA|nr:unnamed protein product [Adineta steineri]CAF1440101.1 unnamed protein product [Adineta steineri]CAF3687921.1 unnamed protein product [Adineta steineri]CAF3857392.1 unnamed protein product [Adineta steineri]